MRSLDKGVGAMLIKPILVLYENYAGDDTTSIGRILDQLGLEPPGDTTKLEPPLKQQADSINDDWVRHSSEIRLPTQFDLTPAAAQVR